MKKVILMLICAFLFGVHSLWAQSYNTLRIPDTLSGTTFNLTARDTFKQMIPGQQTVTAAYNGNFWGPTLIWKRGDVIQMHVNNQLQDTTTVHWHGMHLPAIMDGGPHQLIPPYTTWSPYWKVDNNAGTYWYHPHLHMEAEHQLDQGLGGLIIIRDSIESALALPRTYGVDDIPLALSDRRFDASNQISDAPYGDSMMVNGTLRPQFSVPAQVVRFRLLDAGVERSYNIGFSDNRTFYVISTDGGLVDTPVAVTRFLISAGERVEIVTNFSGKQGTSVDLMAYNSVLTQSEPGGDVFPSGTPFYNALARIDFKILHLNITTATSNAITAIPSKLTTNTFYSASSANLTRYLTISDTNITGSTGVSFVINHKLYSKNYINYQVPLNNTEIWQITSSSNFSHPFHIHDVQFYILSRNGVAAPNYEQGWKDVVLVHNKETVKFIARFSDYSDSTHPYMYHCHIALHEDEGMMQQFIVGNSPAGIMNIALNSKLKIFPNPTSAILHFELDKDIVPTKGVMINTAGQTVMEFIPTSNIYDVDVSKLANGIYFIRLTDTNGANYIKTYLKE